MDSLGKQNTYQQNLPWINEGNIFRCIHSPSINKYPCLELCTLLNFLFQTIKLQLEKVGCKLRLCFNPGPAAHRYALPLQTV